MSIKIISALSSNRVIGYDGKIPWFIKGELKRFKELTLNHNVVMGRKTFDSIGKTLEQRNNIIISTIMIILCSYNIIISINILTSDRILVMSSGSSVHRVPWG